MTVREQILQNASHINGVADIVLILICVAAYVYIFIRLINSLGSRQIVLYSFLLLERLGFTLYYYLHTKHDLSDSSIYYLRVTNPELFYDSIIRFGFATQFIKSLLNILYSLFHVSYLTCFIIFSTIGFVGFYYFIKVIVALGFKKNTRFFAIYVLPTILFLPNIHMWTVAIGKDSLMFFSLMLFTHSLLNIKKSIFSWLFASFLMFMIRPHVYLMVFSAIIIALLIFSDRALWLTLFYSFILLPFLIMGMKIFTESVVNIEFSITSMIAMFESRQGYFVTNDYTGSMVDTSGYPFPYKVFSYLYRPLFEKMDIRYLFVGFDNIGSLFFSLILFSKYFYHWLKRSSFVVQFSMCFFVLGVTFFALVFSNFGIAVRQKTQFIFSLYIVAIAFLTWRQSLKHYRLNVNNED